MTRAEFINFVNQKIKLVRTEKGYSQDKMTEVLGISKKTLIQIEKGRSSLGWTNAVAFCTIFQDSEILNMTFGGDINYLILSLAFSNYNKEYCKTMGGKVWWRDVENLDNCKIQQNIISGHFRLLDADNRRICSTFDFEYVKLRLGEMALQSQNVSSSNF
jgi:DNA-binding XRE family transcriptional regulator